MVYSRSQDLKAHKTKKRHHYHQIIKVSGTAKKAVVHEKMEEAQDNLPTAKWGDEPAKNCWSFEYLGSIMTVDGGHMADVKRRIAMTNNVMERCVTSGSRVTFIHDSRCAYTSAQYAQS